MVVLFEYCSNFKNAEFFNSLSQNRTFRRRQISPRPHLGVGGFYNLDWRAVCLLRNRCAMFLCLRISAGCLWEVEMLISPALANHDTPGGGGISIEAILPLILIVGAIVCVLLFVGRKKGRRRKPRRAGSSHKRHR